MDTPLLSEIFYNEHHSHWSYEDNCLDLNEFLLIDSTHLSQDSPQPVPQPVIEEFQFENFVHIVSSPQEEVFSQPEPNVVSQGEKRQPKSIATKNVCFNICQKAIKVIQKKEYEAKVKEICNRQKVTTDEFLQHILSAKKNFTGPKALQMYVDERTPLTETFREFFSWFLREKYLRHCLKGDMINKEAYIKYKNEVILVILS